MANSTAPKMPYPGYHGDQDRGPMFRVFAIVMLTFVLVSMACRITSRLLTPGTTEYRKFWWDDYVAFAVMPLAIALHIVTFFSIELGLGQHIWNIPRSAMGALFRLMFAAEPIFMTAMTLVRMSTLLFYARIFRLKVEQSWARITLYAIHAMNICWFFGVLLVDLFNCTPVSKGWKPTIAGQCRSIYTRWLSSVIPLVVIDLLILLFPMPQIWRLKISAKRRTQLIISFMIGYMTVIAPIGRLVTILKLDPALTEDPTYEMVPVWYWFAVELDVSIISICLPTLVNLRRRIAVIFMPISSKLSLPWSSRSSRTASDASDQNQQKRERNKTKVNSHSFSSDNGRYHVCVTGGGDMNEGEKYLVPGIYVTKVITTTRVEDMLEEISLD